ncbi:cyclophilin-like protein [Fistulina hepatica ATCC 64428]|uniref:Peptidyl-prolyl isomerase CWC27 n=1 Tax=Fistulina hepatica ATCC 64428 TaxID=1128425 RepID=A0A0D7ABD1_9AGAR|nr:cyclophilin-like protein [Fistulina hepatica ATCC 64428]
MSLPTRGRVILETTAGDIDIELWSKEAPKACRNFIALSLEGYYDGVIFHRIVPGFLVQTGDRTGTGGGGESFFGEPFEDEIHPRLRFAHRGLVAMANNGTKNSNDSQFIITLDRADELHGKHTLFGRCVGDTVYNVMKIGEMEIDKTERPLYPPKIKRVRVVDNPFDDIVPRITAEEKRAQQKAREQAQREREEEIKRKGAKKNVNLLSFADDPEEADSEPTIKKTAIVRPDLAEPGPTARVPNFVVELSAPQTDKNGKRGRVDSPEEPKSSKKGKEKEEDITKIREQHAREHASEADARKVEIAKMEEEIRKLNKKRGGDDSDDEPTKKRPKVSYLEQEMAKYKKLQRPGKRRDEGDVLAALDSFRGKLQSRLHGDSDAMGDHADAAGGAEAKDAPLATEDPGVEVDDDLGFLGHELHFPKDDGEETRKAEHDYEVIDPRQRGAQAKEEERKRKERSLKGNGGRGRRYR